MNDKKIDKKIRANIEIPNVVPDNINNIFDRFIDENLNCNGVMKITTRKIATIVASALATVATGGVIYAAVNGMDIGKIFNINQANYEKEIITIQEEVTSGDLNVKLETYAMDCNAIVINYSVKAKNNEELKLSDVNIAAGTYVNNEIPLKITSQAAFYDEEIKGYRVSTLYAIEQFEDTLDNFSMNVEITELFGKKGDWKFNLSMDKSKKVEDRTYFFRNMDGYAERFGVKTNYLPIAMSIDDISVSNFSSVTNISIYNYPYATTGYENNMLKVAEASKSKEWKEVEPLKLEIMDSDGNLLYKEYYNYTRAELPQVLKNKKLIFPNFSNEMKELTFKVYLIGADKKEELVATKVIKLGDEASTSSKRFNLDKTVKYEGGDIEVKTSSMWRCEEQNGHLSISRANDFGGVTEIQIIKFSEEVLNNMKSKGVDINSEKSVAQAVEKQDFESQNDKSNKEKIISEGQTKIGNYEGYQMIYTTELDESGSMFFKDRIFVFKINEKMYLASIMVDSSNEEYENCREFFENVISSIKY